VARPRPTARVASRSAASMPPPHRSRASRQVRTPATDTSIAESRPKPMRLTAPASHPAVAATAPSMRLQVMVSRSRRRPSWTASSRERGDGVQDGRASAAARGSIRSGGIPTARRYTAPGLSHPASRIRSPRGGLADDQPRSPNETPGSSPDRQPLGQEPASIAWTGQGSVRGDMTKHTAPYFQPLTPDVLVGEDAGREAAGASARDPRAAGRSRARPFRRLLDREPAPAQDGSGSVGDHKADPTRRVIPGAA
jgi:hypothetical protein